MSFLERIKNNRRKYMLIISAIVLGTTVSWISLRNNAYALSVDGKVVAIIKEKETAKVAYESLVKEIKEEVGVNIAVRETLTIEPVHSSSKELKTEEEVKVALAQSVNYDIAACEILVDDKSYAVVENKAVAEEVLTYIAKQYLPEDGSLVLDVEGLLDEDEKLKESDENEATTSAELQAVEETITTGTEVIEVKEALPEEEVEEVVKVGAIEVEQTAKVEDESGEGQKIVRETTALDFNEKVVVKNVYVDAESILTGEEALDILLGNNLETLEYTLEEGDNIWDVAVANGTTMEHILEMNPQIEDETKMQIGETIKLEVPDPILSITTVEEATFKELIPADIQYVEFSDLYADQTKVYREGHDGLKEITVAVTKVNGKEVSRKLLSESILQEAKIKVIAYGTKERPKKTTSSSSSSNSSNAGESVSSSGKFIHPLNGNGYISSGYGSRWGSFHKGIDYAAPAGTPIYASAAGKVIYSGYNSGGYGKLVIIDHGNGYQTYYGHCSSLYVSVGQNVSQGQHIAGVGSTGDSTGNHIHFEIRSDGTPINPSNYVD